LFSFFLLYACESVIELPGYLVDLTFYFLPKRMWQGSWWKSPVACLDLLDKSANEIAFSTNYKNNKECMYVNSMNGKFYFYPPLIACFYSFLAIAGLI